MLGSSRAILALVVLLPHLGMARLLLKLQFERFSDRHCGWEQGGSVTIFEDECISWDDNVPFGSMRYSVSTLYPPK